MDKGEKISFHPSRQLMIEKQTGGQWFLDFFQRSINCRIKHLSSFSSSSKRSTPFCLSSPGTFSPLSRTRSIEATHLLRQMGVVGIDVIVSSWRKRHTSVVTDTVLSSGTIDPTASFCPVLRRLGGRVGELRGRRWRRRDWVWLVIPHPVYLKYFKFFVIYSSWWRAFSFFFLIIFFFNSTRSRDEFSSF